MLGNRVVQIDLPFAHQLHDRYAGNRSGHGSDSVDIVILIWAVTVS